MRSRAAVGSERVGDPLVELHAGAVIGIFAGKPSEPQRTGRHPSASGTMPRIEGAELLVPSEALLGVLCIKDERVSDAFASAELDVLIGVAAQLGITLQNSKLYDRMKERDRLAALGQMAAGLAHEIRNPLGAIKGAAEFIAPLPDGKVPEDTGDWPVLIGDFDAIPKSGTLAANEVCSHLYRLCSRGQGYGSVGL